MPEVVNVPQGQSEGGTFILAGDMEGSAGKWSSELKQEGAERPGPV